MTGTIYFIMNNCLDTGKRKFIDLNKILLFRKWCITFSLIEKIILFSYILYATIWHI